MNSTEMCQTALASLITSHFSGANESLWQQPSNDARFFFFYKCLYLWIICKSVCKLMYFQMKLFHSSTLILKSYSTHCINEGKVKCVTAHKMVFYI